MKSLFISFILLFSLPDTDIPVYRDLLARSANNAETAQFFFNKTKSIELSEKPVLRGYKAMASFIMCKHAVNPFTKLNYFNKGKKELDAAIFAESGNIELLFLRFATQCHVPVFLNYSSNMESDKKMLLNYLANKSLKDDNDLRIKITKFMLECKHCTAAEKKIIQSN
ncbi:MAG: hypothetical protein IT236_19250 [Bacteroidia bacterium]|nr:hypothetical protein [Bacteroidia bacterium]